MRILTSLKNFNPSQAEAHTLTLARTQTVAPLVRTHINVQTHPVTHFPALSISFCIFRSRPCAPRRHRFLSPTGGTCNFRCIFCSLLFSCGLYSCCCCCCWRNPFLCFRFSFGSTAAIATAAAIKPFQCLFVALAAFGAVADVDCLLNC